MRKILPSISVLLLLVSWSAFTQIPSAREAKYLKDYMKGGYLYVVDNKVVHPDSLECLKSSAIEDIQTFGRPNHIAPRIKFKLDGQKISSETADSIIVADILYVTMESHMTLNIVTKSSKSREE